MMHEPVFQDSFEVNVWKKITSGKESASKNHNYYISIAEAVIKRDKPMNSSVLSFLIRELYEMRVDGMQTLIDQLVSKSKPNECMPALTASSVYADLDDWDKA